MGKVIKSAPKHSIPKLLKLAEQAFNAYIRERDKEKGCISCGGPVENAGHYFSAGHYSALRFNEINVNAQCIRCNLWLHGNLILYRNGLIKKYGEQKVLILESSARNPYKKWSRTDLEIIITTYKRLKNELNNKT